jgi:hypothetical protein
VPVKQNKRILWRLPGAGPGLPPSRRGLTLLLGAALLLAAPPVLACSVCACGDPLLSTGDPAAIAGTLRLQLDVEALRVDAANDANRSDTDQLTQWSYRLNAVWRPSSDLSLSATLPFLHKVIRTVGDGTAVTASDLSGLGDVELGARYALWRSVEVGVEAVQELAISGGSAVPTGRHQARGAGGAVLDPHGQLGTGGWGPFAGLHYRLELGEWTGFASVAYLLRTRASYSDPEGTLRYKFGDAFLWSAHAQVLLARRLALDLGVDGRSARKDEATGTDGSASRVEATGGTLLSAAPGLYLDAAGGLWVFVRAQIPIYKALFDRQDVKPSVTAGIQYQVL